ncbi:MarR family winged helix-turn-helix transcriptional regulator [Glaciibacter superstes]|uniref:MarR family winged helix-turn-helix transcriptional regulator n=1 Tax=Glaciibacter superstes TaxID=501023 RepID=UPI0003B4223E|nr:MarR family transcriptional regulator [Glaciibacter superstes]
MTLYENSLRPERLAEQGHNAVHPAHVAVFATLDPDGTRVSTRAGRAGISRQAMSALVRALEASGYVTTETDPADQRATLVRLDRLGAEFCRAAVVASAEFNTEVERKLGKADTDRIRSALRTLIE